MPAPSAAFHADIAAAPRPASTPPPASHEVAPGENLSRIVRDFLRENGQAPTNVETYRAVQTVARENGLRNPDLIFPGQVLDLSSLRNERPSANTPDGAALLQKVHGLPAGPAVAPGANPARPADTAPPTPAPGAASDPLRTDGAVHPDTGPRRVSANAVAALMAPPEPAADPVPLARRSGATGGPGPVPSDAARALQRVLNRTSNALNLLRDLVEPGAKEADSVENDRPWSALLQDKARLSSEFGTRRDPFSGKMGFHDGIDLAVKRGTGVTAVRDGEVVFSGWKGGYGNTVILRHDNGVETLYGHAARTRVRVGDAITAGTVIAEAGASGRSTGPHLHFEVREHGRAVNPMPYLEASGGSGAGLASL